MICSAASEGRLLNDPRATDGSASPFNDHGIPVGGRPVGHKPSGADKGDAAGLDLKI